MTTIAEELESRLWTLADPKTRWRRAAPVDARESCLVMDGGNVHLTMSVAAQDWLDDFVDGYDEDEGGSWGAATWNDWDSRTRNQVLWMLEEAIEQARWEAS